MTEWFTLGELSAHLKLSRPTLYKLAQTGKIPAVKVGRAWRFNRERVDSWMEKAPTPVAAEFPWSDCLDVFLKKLVEKFGRRFASLWIYGSWARGEARPDSDVDLLVVLDPSRDYWKDFDLVTDLAYGATFGRDRPVVFSAVVTDQETFLASMEPLLMNVRREGRKAA